MALTSTFSPLNPLDTSISTSFATLLLQSSNPQFFAIIFLSNLQLYETQKKIIIIKKSELKIPIG